MNLIINKNRAISSFYYEYEKYFFSNLFTTLIVDNIKVLSECKFCYKNEERFKDLKKRKVIWLVNYFPNILGKSSFYVLIVF